MRNRMKLNMCTYLEHECISILTLKKHIDYKRISIHHALQARFLSRISASYSEASLNQCIGMNFFRMYVAYSKLDDNTQYQRVAQCQYALLGLRPEPFAPYRILWKKSRGLPRSCFPNPFVLVCCAVTIFLLNMAPCTENKSIEQIICTQARIGKSGPG